jgi:hypothetical protein
MAFLAKRRFPRETRREGVKIVSAQGVEYGTFEDISAGGLKLTLDRSADVGEILELEFRPRSGEKDIHAPVRVVRSMKKGRDFEIGVVFLGSFPQLASLVDPKQGPF